MIPTLVLGALCATNVPAASPFETLACTPSASTAREQGPVARPPSEGNGGGDTRPASDARTEEPRTYRFQSEPINGLGIARLEELRGKPVLVEFWGAACPNCVRSAVPAALKLQETFGDDLQVLLVESQGATGRQAESFALTHRWLGGRAMWTSEAPLRVRGNTLPKFALLGNDGRVLLAGNPLDQPKEIERQIAEQIRDRKRPPADVPEALRPAWSEFLRGRLAQALELIDAEIAHADVAGSACGAGAGISARSTREAFLQRYTLELERVERLRSSGLVEEATERLEAVGPAVAGIAELEARLAGVREGLASAEAGRERQLAAVLGRLLTRFYASGGSQALAGELRAFAERSPGTKAAERAARAAALVAE